jgi:multiple sugar transport system ATP-binding protein
MAEIRIERLTKNFGGLLAVNDLDLTVSDGAFVALLGPSGCGKTTTMNMISGLEKPTRGEIYFDGQPITSVEPGKRGVGFVFQNYAIFTHMTVYDNLAFGLRVRKPRPGRSEIDGEVKRVAAIVGIAGQLERRAGRLSVNDMQKVALGRSMIVQPSIFLLDEPFSNLDASFRAYMRAELKHIQHEIGQTMMYVTHDQVEAMGMADMIAVMDHGVLQQYATPHDLYNHPANTFVAGFVGSTRINFLPGHKVGVPTGGSGQKLTIAFRPEYAELVASDSAASLLGGKVTLVEPLGAKDVVHVDSDGYDVRVVAAPGVRPRIGEPVGIAVPKEHTLHFDEATGVAVTV